MALNVKKQVACPPGQNRGIITQARETTKVFDPRTGPEPVVEVTIQPAHKVEGFQTMPVSVVFAANLSTLGGLYAFLKRVGHEPKTDSFNVESIDGTEVVFLAETKDNFVNVKKDSIRAAQ